MRVFLGGTCNESTWRDELIPRLLIEYFNPVVDNWDETAYKRELMERETCDYCLYVITPKMTGVYSIAEAVDDSNKRPKKTIFCIRPTDGSERFSTSQLRSLEKVGQMIENNGGKWIKDFKNLHTYLNSIK